MNLKTKSISLVAICFIVIFSASYVFLQVLGKDIRAGLATMYAKEQVNYNREKVLHPVIRELALARKLAVSAPIRGWVNNEDNPAFRTAALKELEGFRQFFSDQSYFFAIKKSGHYYYNDRNNRYLGSEQRYTLNPDSDEDLWFYRTIESNQEYALNVDYDEKLKETKIWVNVVVRDAGHPVGIIGTGIDLSDFIATVVNSDQAGVTNIFVEESGAIQAFNNKSHIDFRTISKDEAERKTIFQLMDSPEGEVRLRDAIERLKSGQREVEVLSAAIGGNKFLIGVGAIPEIDWFNITLLDTTSIIAPKHIIPFAVLIFSALLLLSIALIMLLNRFVLNRISRLDNLVKAFADGEEPVFSGNNLPDEMGRLENSFYQMSIKIRKHEQTLEDKVAERTKDLAEKNDQLRQALADIKVLRGLLPICMYCKGIRNDEGAWVKLERYIAEHSEIQFSHGICDNCMKEKHPQCAASPEVSR